jgi:hypothetical protein
VSGFGFGGRVGFGVVFTCGTPFPLIPRPSPRRFELLPSTLRVMRSGTLNETKRPRTSRYPRASIAALRLWGNRWPGRRRYRRITRIMYRTRLFGGWGREY